MMPGLQMAQQPLMAAFANGNGNMMNDLLNHGNGFNASMLQGTSICSHVRYDLQRLERILCVKVQIFWSTWQVHPRWIDWWIIDWLIDMLFIWLRIDQSIGWLIDWYGIIGLKQQLIEWLVD